MRTSRRVSLNTTELDTLDPRIVITGIDEQPANETLEAEGTLARAGQRVTQSRRNYLEVGVRFAMDIPKTQMAERSQLLEKVNKWARVGGTMRLNYRPGRRLLVMLAQAPGEGDLFRWTNEFTLVFRAYQVPYWTDETPVMISSSINAGAAFPVEVPGSAETVADVTITNGSGMPITSIDLSIGGNAMQFRGNTLLPAGQAITIDHPANTMGPEYIRMVNGNGSVMKFRTGANDFYMQPGTNQVSFTASRAVRVLVSVRGRYL